MYYCEISSSLTAYVYDGDAGKLVGIFTEYDAKKVVKLLNTERRATQKTEPKFLFPHVYKRTFRDVACRYIKRFGGTTYMLQTDVDDGEVYLRNVYGEVIASVSAFDRFPKPIDAASLQEIPY